VAAEGFADRAYERDGSLTPRNREGAVLQDPLLSADRAVAMVRDGTIQARDGSPVQLRVDTICIHSDTRGAADVAAAVRARLTEAGIVVAALGAS
jgi:UPF0271 protein